MKRARNDILQGTLDLLVLKCLAAQGSMHGYALTAYIQRVSAEQLRVEEGSLYPALHRMEQAGWVKAEWGTTEKNRQARFYNPIWEQDRDGEPPFARVLAYGDFSVNLADAGEVRPADGLWVSGSFLETLGVLAAAGRLLTSADDAGGCAATAVISHAFWQSALGADPGVIGRTISFSGHQVEMIGVASPAFRHRCNKFSLQPATRTTPALLRVLSVLCGENRSWQRQRDCARGRDARPGMDPMQAHRQD